MFINTRTRPPRSRFDRRPIYTGKCLRVDLKQLVMGVAWRPHTKRGNIFPDGFDEETGLPRGGRSSVPFIGGGDLEISFLPGLTLVLWFVYMNPHRDPDDCSTY